MKLYSLLLALFMSATATLFAQVPSAPSPFNLGSGDYSLTSWATTNANGTYPPNMQFYLFPTIDNTLATNETSSLWTGSYAATSSTRIVGYANGDGIGFVSTGTSGSGSPSNGFAGAAILALNTTNRLNVRVGFTAGSIAQSVTNGTFRNYAIILEYKLPNDPLWQVVIGNGGPTDTVQFKAPTVNNNPGISTISTASQAFTVTLPTRCENQGVVYLRWRYFQWSGITTGTRPQMRIDDILVQSDQNTGIPTKFVVTGISPTSPSVNTPFSVTVQSVNDNNQPRNVQANTAVQVTLAAGTGALGGTLTGTMTGGTNTLVLNAVQYNTVESGVQVTVSRTSGDNLSAATSSPFTVLPRATTMIVGSIPATSFTNSPLPQFTVTAVRNDQTTDINYPGPYTITKLSGPGNIVGTTVRTPLNGVATYNDIAFDAPGQYVLTISGPNLPTFTSSTITVVALPTMTELVMPQFMGAQGVSAPAWALVRFDNLQPNTTYRYHTSAAEVNNVTGFAAGTCIHQDVDNNLLFYPSAFPFNDNLTPGRFSSFTTGPAATSQTVWINVIPSSNARFLRGNQMFWYVTVRDANRALDTRIVSTGRTRTLALSTNIGDGSAVVDTASGLQSKTIVCLYDNEAGTGNPLATAVVQDDGATVPGSPTFYQLLDGRLGAWATVLPNTLATGVRRIEVRSLQTGAILNSFTSNNGTWFPVNTVNPNTGTSSLVIPTPNIQVATSITGSSYCITAPLNITWASRGVQNVNIQYTTNGSTWFDIATNIPSSLSLFAWNVPTSLAGTRTMQLRITDAARANVSSTSGTFSVNTPAQITSQTGNIAPCMGGTAFMEVVVSGTNLSFQWQKDGVDLPGATSPRLTLTFVNLGSTGIYQCVVNGAAGCAGTVSKPILLSITPNIQVINQPGNIVSGIGRTVVMSVETNTPTGVVYLWYRRGTPLVDNSRLTGSRTANLTIRNLQTSDFGSDYYCVVSSICGTTQSEFGTISTGTVTITTPQLPTVVTQCVGESFVFSVQATSSTSGALNYVWRKNGVNLTNDSRYNGSQRTERLTISSLTIADTGLYTCVVTSTTSGAQAISSPLALIIQTAPTVTTQPTNQTSCTGESAQFTLVSSGGATNYTWLLNGVLYRQTTQPTLALSNVSSTDAGTFRCIVSNQCGSDTTREATLTIGEKTIITVQPRASIRLLEGGTIVLSVEATGTNLRYQWFKGSDIISGTAGQSQTLTISNALYRDRGTYSCRVTGDCGIVNSSESVIDIITNVEEEDAAGITLSQNAPNPASDVTTITYYVPQQSLVSLTITDMLGRTVATLANEEQSTGIHTSTYDTGNLTNGTYTYTLRVGSRILSKRMTIVR